MVDQGKHEIMEEEVNGEANIKVEEIDGAVDKDFEVQDSPEKRHVINAAIQAETSEVVLDFGSVQKCDE